MQKSETIAALAAALAKAQGEMDSAKKDSENPFFKSNYADLSSVWAAIRAPLSKHGLCVIQSINMDNGTPRLITMLAHSSGEWVASHLPINPVKNDPQGIGSAITYMRRYAVSALVGVAAEEDDDGEAAQGRGAEQPNPQQPRPQPKPAAGPAPAAAPPAPAAPIQKHPGAPLVTDKQLGRLFAIAGGKNWQRRDVDMFVMEKFKKKDLKTLSRGEYDEICNHLLRLKALEPSEEQPPAPDEPPPGFSGDDDVPF
jgi:hypothetical protein